MATAWVCKLVFNGAVFGVVAPFPQFRALRTHSDIPVLDWLQAFAVVLMLGLLLVVAVRVGSIIRKSIADMGLIRRWRRGSNGDPSWQTGAAARLRRVETAYEELYEQLRPHLKVEHAADRDDPRSTLRHYRTSLTDLRHRLAQLSESEDRERH